MVCPWHRSFLKPCFLHRWKPTNFFYLDLKNHPIRQCKKCHKQEVYIESEFGKQWYPKEDVDFYVNMFRENREAIEQVVDAYLKMKGVID